MKSTLKQEDFSFCTFISKRIASIKYKIQFKQIFNYYIKHFSGAIFEQGTDDIQSAFAHAVSNHNKNASTRRFELQVFADVINTADAFKLSRLSEFSTILLILFYTTKGK